MRVSQNSDRRVHTDTASFHLRIQNELKLGRRVNDTLGLAKTITKEKGKPHEEEEEHIDRREKDDKQTQGDLNKTMDLVSHWPSPLISQSVRMIVSKMNNGNM